MNSIRFEQVSKSYGKTKVINHLDLDIKKGERMILLGPSGCGKSTILRMISGLETVTQGKLFLNDVLANNIDSGDRNIAMVFQNYALYPHMTIEENVGYGLRIKKEKKDVIKEKVGKSLGILELTGLEKRYPKELSGGQRQRVALARALVKSSDFFLLDEPLSNLDAQLRGQARKELVKIHELYKQTFIYVTHDQIEAMTIGDRIALMNGGDLQMLDTPHNVYHRPANIFAATFIGSPSMNIIEARIEGREIYLGKEKTELPDRWIKHIRKSSCRDLKMGIRPEDVVLSHEKGPVSIPAEIRYVEDYGNRVGYYFQVGEEEVISIIPENLFSRNDKVYWNLKPEKLHFFNGETTVSLGYPEGI